ncbi:MAG: carboxymuconolactone decarboxylase family protein [Burkholderiales bacterium]|nr:carboxymuconolactone decarboxylase family protein [Burkholderiales bacterium]
MSRSETSRPVEQGFATGASERLPMPAPDALSPAQRSAAQVLIDGPRKAVYGPFVPLLRQPVLLDRVAQLGETLRFHGSLPANVRELVTCAVACHVGNQFEWVMHQPLALAAGVDAGALEALRVGARPTGLADDEQRALDLCQELLTRHGVADATYAAALARFGEAGVVELGTLIGYFAMVSWLMNLARTPSRPTATVAPLPAHPA